MFGWLTYNKERDLWDNPGLLIGEAARDKARSDAGGAFFAFDWLEFRTEWEDLDDKVKAKKHYLQLAGVLATLCIGLSAALLAISGNVSHELVKTITVSAGAILAVCAIGFAIWHYIQHKNRTGWLIMRLLVERLRHMYHQLILKDIHLILDAVGDETARAAFLEQRAERFTYIKDQLMSDMKKGWSNIRQDDDSKFALIAFGPPSEPTENIAARVASCQRASDTARLVLEQVGRQRFETQGQFAKSQLLGTVRSKSFNQNTLHVTFIACILLTPVFAFIAAMLMWTDVNEIASVFVTLSAISTAIGLSARVLETGLGYSKDIKRYDTYLTWIVDAAKEFNIAMGEAPDEPDFEAALNAWIKLETAAYVEMQQFFMNHEDDNFFN